MSEAAIITIARDALMTALHVALPMLVAALATGVLVSIFQVATSIQDPTLSVVPKVVAVLTALLLSLNWIIHVMVSFTMRVLDGIPGLVE